MLMASSARRRALLVGAAVFVFCLLPALSQATSDPYLDPLVYGPFLGEPGRVSALPDLTGFPANPALLWPLEIQGQPGGVVPHPTLANAWQPMEPLSAGTHSFTSDPGDANVVATIESTGVVDDVAPSVPELISVEYFGNESPSGCRKNYAAEDNSGVAMEFAPLSDDATPRERVTLAIYGGYSASEAAISDSPILVVLYETSRFFFANAASGYTHLAVSAVDLAGNESARTTAFTYETTP